MTNAQAKTNDSANPSTAKPIAAERRTFSTNVAGGGIENRRTPRRIFEHPVGLLHGGGYEVVHALQLSEGGILIRVGRELVVKDQVVISIMLPGGGSLVARGEVIYEKSAEGKVARGGRDFGVRFASLALNQRRLIRAYVTAKTQAEAEAEKERDFRKK